MEPSFPNQTKDILFQEPIKTSVDSVDGRALNNKMSSNGDKSQDTGTRYHGVTNSSGHNMGQTGHHMGQTGHNMGQTGVNMGQTGHHMGQTDPSVVAPTGHTNGGQPAQTDVTDHEAESEERRRAAHRVFQKQGSQSRSVGRLPLPTSSQPGNMTSNMGGKSPSSPHHSGLPPPPPVTSNKEQRSISSIQTYRSEQNLK